MMTVIIFTPSFLEVDLTFLPAFFPPYRGKIHTGEHTLHLWEFHGTSSTSDGRGSKKSKKTILEEEREAFSQILAGPATNNPSPDAIKATVCLPERNVFCPSPSKQSRDSFL